MGVSDETIDGDITRADGVLRNRTNRPRSGGGFSEFPTGYRSELGKVNLRKNRTDGNSVIHFEVHNLR